MAATSSSLAVATSLSKAISAALAGPAAGPAPRSDAAVGPAAAVTPVSQPTRLGRAGRAAGQVALLVPDGRHAGCCSAGGARAEGAAGATGQGQTAGPAQEECSRAQLPGSARLQIERQAGPAQRARALQQRRPEAPRGSSALARSCARCGLAGLAISAPPRCSSACARGAVLRFVRRRHRGFEFMFIMPHSLARSVNELDPLTRLLVKVTYSE